MKVESSFSRYPPRGTHVPQSIIYGTPRGKHLKVDSADMVGFELLREGYVGCITLMLIVC